MAEVNGFCDPRFAPLRDVFVANLDDGTDEGASLAVTYQGEFVVDLWGGTRDRKREHPWERDTIVRVMSSSKVMVIVATLMVVDRGLVDLDAPLATYWPEFARHGKGGVTVRQVLTHQSGLPGFGRSVSWDDLADWDRIIHILEDAELWFEPGVVTCYHPQTYGYLLGELVHRVSGMSFDEFFRTELSGPLAADFHFGLTDDADRARVARIWPEAIADDAPDLGKRLLDEVTATYEWMVPECTGAIIPASSGFANGRSLARVGAMLAMGGELDGRRYLGRALLDEATREYHHVEDLVMGWGSYGLGFGLNSVAFPAPTPTSFHWGGHGGSFLTMDMATGISCGFTPNRWRVVDELTGDRRLISYFSTLGDVSRSLTRSGT